MARQRQGQGRYNRNNRGDRGDRGYNQNKKPKFDDSRHYKSFKISKVASNVDQPGSYTRVFHASYTMLYQPNEENTNSPLPLLPQIIHSHINGLCIVTAGKEVLSHIQKQQQTIKQIKYLIKIPSDTSVVGGKNKKKKQAEMLKKGGRIHPKDPLMEITLGDDSVIILYSCVLGTIVDWNECLLREPSLLMSDPFGLGSYLAILLPLGSFPPDGLAIDGLNDKDVEDREIEVSVVRDVEGSNGKDAEDNDDKMPIEEVVESK